MSSPNPYGASAPMSDNFGVGVSPLRASTGPIPASSPNIGRSSYNGEVDPSTLYAQDDDNTSTMSEATDADGLKRKKSMFTRALRKVGKTLTAPEKDESGVRIPLKKSLSKRLFNSSPRTPPSGRDGAVSPSQLTPRNSFTLRMFSRSRSDVPSPLQPSPSLVSDSKLVSPTPSALTDTPSLPRQFSISSDVPTGDLSRVSSTVPGNKSYVTKDIKESFRMAGESLRNAGHAGTEVDDGQFGDDSGNRYRTIGLEPESLESPKSSSPHGLSRAEKAALQVEQASISKRSPAAADPAASLSDKTSAQESLQPVNISGDTSSPFGVLSHKPDEQTGEPESFKRTATVSPRVPATSEPPVNEIHTAIPPVVTSSPTKALSFQGSSSPASSPSSSPRNEPQQASAVSPKHSVNLPLDDSPSDVHDDAPLVSIDIAAAQDDSLDVQVTVTAEDDSLAHADSSEAQPAAAAEPLPAAKSNSIADNTGTTPPMTIDDVDDLVIPPKDMPPVTNSARSIGERADTHDSMHDDPTNSLVPLVDDSAFSTSSVDKPAPVAAVTSPFVTEQPEQRDDQSLHTSATSESSLLAISTKQGEVPHLHLNTSRKSPLRTATSTAATGVSTPPASSKSPMQDSARNEHDTKYTDRYANQGLADIISEKSPRHVTLYGASGGYASSDDVLNTPRVTSEKSLQTPESVVSPSDDQSSATRRSPSVGAGLKMQSSGTFQPWPSPPRMGDWQGENDVVGRQVETTESDGSQLDTLTASKSQRAAAELISCHSLKTFESHRPPGEASRRASEDIAGHPIVSRRRMSVDPDAGKKVAEVVTHDESATVTDTVEDVAADALMSSGELEDASSAQPDSVVAVSSSSPELIVTAPLAGKNLSRAASRRKIRRAAGITIATAACGIVALAGKSVLGGRR